MSLRRKTSLEFQNLITNIIFLKDQIFVQFSIHFIIHKIILKHQKYFPETLNELFGVYTHCVNAAIKEMHFVRSETDRIDWQRLVTMIKAQQTRYW